MIIPAKGKAPLFTVGQQGKTDAYHINDVQHRYPADHPKQLFFPAARIGKNKSDPETGNPVTQATVYQLHAAAANQA